MNMFRILGVAACAMLLAGKAHAGTLEDALVARNPVLSDLRKSNPEAFRSAAKLIIDAEKKQGLQPGDALPDTMPAGRDSGQGAGQAYTVDNPDVLFLSNSSPEGMSDLISILKSAGQKPKT